MAKWKDDFLDKLLGYWREIAQEISEKLGEIAGLFNLAYSDALEIHVYLSEQYSEAELQESLVAFEIPALWKELYWMQFLFLASNYPVVMSRLRFNWEQMFRAYYADTFTEHYPGAPNQPGATIDDKHQWLITQEKPNRLGWHQVMVPTLNRLFLPNGSADGAALLKPLWDRLNSFVHPSGQLRELLIGDSALKVRDGFDEELARNTLADAEEVISLILLLLLFRFPKILPNVQSNAHLFEGFPRVRAVLPRLVGR